MSEQEEPRCEWCGEELRDEQTGELVPLEQIDGGDWHYGCWRSYQNAKERLS